MHVGAMQRALAFKRRAVGVRTDEDGLLEGEAVDYLAQDRVFLRQQEERLHLRRRVPQPHLLYVP